MSLKRKLRALLALQRLQDIIEFYDEEEELDRRCHKRTRNLVYVFDKPKEQQPTHLETEEEPDHSYHKETRNVFDVYEMPRERKPIHFETPSFINRQLDNVEAKILEGILWDGDEHNNFCRMNIDDFEHIFSMVNPKITKKNTVMREAISSRLRLAVTLRFLVTGESYKAIETISQISRKTVSVIIAQVMNGICDTLENEYLKLPSNEDEWKAVSEDFNTTWGFPHALGAVGGKHIQIRYAKKADVNYRNYKDIPSLVLLAVIDANGKFLYIDVGGNGKFADSEIFENSSFNESLQFDMLNIPVDESLPGQEAKTSYFFIGDDIFALDDHLIKAYDKSALSTSQEYFNSKLAQAMTPIDVAFLGLATRFKVFNRQLELEIGSCKLLVKTCCILHNYLTKNLNNGFNCFEQTNEITLPETMMPLLVRPHDTDAFGNEMRDNVKKYLVGECF